MTHGKERGVSEVCPKPETILEEAARLTAKDRQSFYGHPLDDFTCSGRIQAALVDRFLRDNVPNLPPDFRVPDFPAELSAMLQEGVKLSREVHKPKRDNRVDGCGYWNCIDMIHDERSCRAAVASSVLVPFVQVEPLARAAEVLVTATPEAGESHHYVGNGRFVMAAPPVTQEAGYGLRSAEYASGTGRRTDVNVYLSDPNQARR